jgi:flagellar motor switch protein FliN/FliY
MYGARIQRQRFEGSARTAAGESLRFGENGREAMDGTIEEVVSTAAGRDLLLDIELEATLQFGSREVPLKDVLALGPGDVVELDRHVSEPVDLVVGDRIVARGEVVVVNGNFALLITEVAEPRLRLESIRCLF